MKFRKLEIAREMFGKDKGKLVGRLSVEGRDVNMQLALPDALCSLILKACASDVCVAATEEATSFREEYLSTINDGCEEVPS